MRGFQDSGTEGIERRRLSERAVWWVEMDSEIARECLALLKSFSVDIEKSDSLHRISSIRL
jgi:hypothetical protein